MESVDCMDCALKIDIFPIIRLDYGCNLAIAIGEN